MRPHALLPARCALCKRFLSHFIAFFKNNANQKTRNNACIFLQKKHQKKHKKASKKSSEEKILALHKKKQNM
jgi:hypothetical protein